MNKQSGTQNFWQKTRPLQIAVVVIAFAIGSMMLFNRGNSNNGNAASVAVIAEGDSKVVDLTDAVFQQTVAQGVTLVDFWAVWCPPCRIQNPIIEEVAIEMGSKARIAKLDVDHNPASAGLYRVQNIPTLIIFKDGEPVQRFVGVQQRETLVAAIKSHI